jgi:hypothetical protein
MVWMLSLAAVVAFSEPLPLPNKPIPWRSAYMVGFPDSYDTIGFICATGPFEAYTARHVVDALGGHMAWKQGVNGGRLRLAERWEKRDLARVITDLPFPVWAHVAKLPPEQGSTVWGPNRLDADDARPIMLQAQILGLDDADSLIASGPAAFGGSGGCGWNEQGEVIAINFALLLPGQQQPYLRVVFEPLWGDWRTKR